MAAADAGLSPADEASRDLHAILQSLQADLGGILGSVLVDEAGFPLAWDLKGGADPTLIATAGAMVTRIADRTTEVLDFGNLRNAALTTDKGSIGVFRVTPRISLVLLLQPTANNILVVIEVGKALERMREVIAPGF
jgi:predicted regulator of Ras-like GTPase activity (Roadblock/LC7/MglB family)